MDLVKDILIEEDGNTIIEWVLGTSDRMARELDQRLSEELETLITIHQPKTNKQ